MAKCPEYFMLVITEPRSEGGEGDIELRKELSIDKFMKKYRFRLSVSDKIIFSHHFITIHEWHLN